jgi:predicted ATPase
MIKSLSLTNFKCFRGVSLEFGMINVLAGMNGAGKSTVIQSLLAIRQSWESGSLEDGRLQLNGPFAELGTAGEVFCANPSSETVEVAIDATNLADSLRLTCLQAKDRSAEYLLRFEKNSLQSSGLDRYGLFSEPFNYLHAERIGARKVHSISPTEEHPLNVGKFGENAAYIVGSDRRETRLEGGARVLESDDGKEYPTVQYQWELWMARLFPGFNGEAEIYPRADQIRLGLSLQRQETGQALFVRPTNTGFGLSYVLGIVVAGLVARPGTMLIVENPEAHLHPKAQSTLGEFLARVAADGAQVIVETHSEHIMNGVRKMIKQGILQPQDARLYFFGKDLGAFEPTVTPIAVSAKGELSSWPEGFFDQLDKDLNFILT